MLKDEEKSLPIRPMRPIRPPRFKDEPQNASSGSGSSAPPVAPLTGTDDDPNFVMDIIMSAAAAASAAASSAAAESVVSALTRAYGIQLGQSDDPAKAKRCMSALTKAYGIQLAQSDDDPAKANNELSEKMCHMDEKWNCGNLAIKGPEGWHHSRSGGWKKLCQQCKEQIQGQQSGKGGWDGDDSS